MPDAFDQLYIGDAVLQSERLGALRLRGREISRTMRMAEARNKALAGFADEALDWLVVIDADDVAQSTAINDEIQTAWPTLPAAAPKTFL